MRKALAAALFVALITVNLGMNGWYNALFKSQDAAPTALSVMLDALGEIRTFVANEIWLDTDLYHHEMERQGILWNQERDLMSMYKIITVLDPRFVPAYDVASYELVENFHRPKEGLAYLDEGIAHNPDSALLWFDKEFLLYHLKRYGESLNAGGRAMQLFEPDPEKLLQEDMNDQIPFLNTLRYMAHGERELGNRADEIRFLRMWLLLRPGDAYPTRRLKELGLAAVGFTPREFLRSVGR